MSPLEASGDVGLGSAVPGLVAAVVSNLLLPLALAVLLVESGTGVLVLDGIGVSLVTVALILAVGRGASVTEAASIVAVGSGLRLVALVLVLLAGTGAPVADAA